MSQPVSLDVSTTPTAQTARAVLAELFGPPEQRDFRVQLWDGSIEGPSNDSAHRFTVVLRRPGALRRMLLPPSELAIGEAYVRDDFDVVGDLEAATDLAELVKARLRSPARLAHLVRLLRALPSDDDHHHASDAPRETAHLVGRRHSRARDRAAVRARSSTGTSSRTASLSRSERSSPARNGPVSRRATWRRCGSTTR